MSFSFVAAGAIDRASRRWIRAPISPISRAQGPLAMADGTVLQVPSGDERVPNPTEWPPSLHPTFGYADSSLGSAQENVAPWPPTSKHPNEQVLTSMLRPLEGLE